MRAAAGLCALTLTLCGCATQNIEIRDLPAQTPAADNTAAAESAAALAASLAATSGEASAGESVDAPALVTPADAPSMHTYDPWERLNRFTYRFNARVDERLFLPIANQYRRLPAPLRTGVHNFFVNLAEVDSVINYTLQWRPRFGLRSAGRFVINTTAGIGGLFDVAKKLNLPAAQTGFGSTLSVWGLHPGPYLVIPFIGPSTLRDGFGMLADYGASYGINLAGLYRGDASWALGGVNAVNERASVDFRYYASGSPFEYETIRFLYVRKRLIEDAGLHRRDVPTRPDSALPAGR